MSDELCDFENRRHAGPPGRGTPRGGAAAGAQRQPEHHMPWHEAHDALHADAAATQIKAEG